MTTERATPASRARRSPRPGRRQTRRGCSGSGCRSACEGCDRGCTSRDRPVARPPPTPAAQSAAVYATVQEERNTAPNARAGKTVACTQIGNAAAPARMSSRQLCCVHGNATAPWRWRRTARLRRCGAGTAWSAPRPGAPVWTSSAASSTSPTHGLKLGASSNRGLTGHVQLKGAESERQRSHDARARQTRASPSKTAPSAIPRSARAAGAPHSGVHRRLVNTRNVTWLTCGVNLRPPNAESLRFHAAIGFGEVGRLETRDGLLVSLQQTLLNGAA